MKKFLSLLLAAVMVLCMAACAPKAQDATTGATGATGTTGTTDASKPTEGGATTGTTEATKAPAAPVTLNVVTSYGGDDGNRKNFENAVKEFEASTGNKVNDGSATSNEEWKAKVLTDFETGSEPDVLFFFTNADAVNYIMAGRLLLDDGKERKKGALLKYGENHTKTGAALGLLFELDKIYFVSCLGAVWNDLNSDQKHRLLVRTLLRDNLIKKLIFMSEYQDFISMRFLFNCLSDSSFGRRKSNVQKILKILYTSEEYDFKNIIDKCNWSMQLK